MSLRRPNGKGTAGQSQRAEADTTALDACVREHLAAVLMRMTPRDNLLSDPARNWCLADDRSESALFYSLEGEALNFADPLPRKSYSGVWFDPRTGKTTPAAAPPLPGAD